MPTPAFQIQKELDRRHANQPRTPETKHWLAWGLSTGKIDVIPAKEDSFRIVRAKGVKQLTQQQIAGKLSYVLGTKIGQQRIMDMRQKVEKWIAANLPAQDFAQLIEESDKKDLTVKDLENLANSERQIVHTPPKPARR